MACMFRLYRHFVRLAALLQKDPGPAYQKIIYFGEKIRFRKKSEYIKMVPESNTDSGTLKKEADSCFICENADKYSGIPMASCRSAF